jgi:integrase
MYYAGLRPGEVNALRATDLSRPEEGWGELALNLSDPATSLGWTDEGKREPRQLKHRAEDDVRYVPVVPPVTAILRRHLAKYGTALDGRLFRGPRGGPIAEAIYGRVDATEVDSPLASRPYDLRHAAVSTWLNAGVPATLVAEWAGHSVHVLLRVYAKCILGQDEAARRRVEAALGLDVLEAA